MLIERCVAAIRGLDPARQTKSDVNVNVDGDGDGAVPSPSVPFRQTIEGWFLGSKVHYTDFSPSIDHKAFIMPLLRLLRTTTATLFDRPPTFAAVISRNTTVARRHNVGCLRRVGSLGLF